MAYSVWKAMRKKYMRLKLGLSRSNLNMSSVGSAWYVNPNMKPTLPKLETELQELSGSLDDCRRTSTTSSDEDDMMSVQSEFSTFPRRRRFQQRSDVLSCYEDLPEEPRPPSSSNSDEDDFLSVTSFSQYDDVSIARPGTSPVPEEDNVSEDEIEEPSFMVPLPPPLPPPCPIVTPVLGPVAQMVRDLLGPFYGKDVAEGPVLAREARDLFVVHFGGDLRRLREEFMEPLVDFLQDIHDQQALHPDEIRPSDWPLTSGERVLLHLGEQTSSSLHLCAQPAGAIPRATPGTTPGTGSNAPPGPGVGLIWRRHCGSQWFPVAAAALRTPAELRAAMAVPLVGALDPLGSIPHIDSDEEDPLIACAILKCATPLAKRQDSQGSAGNVILPPKSVAELPDRLLSGGVQLPGVHDVTGRPLVVYDAPLAQQAKLTPTELATALLYFMSVPRKDTLRNGVTLLAVLAADTVQDCDEALRSLDEALCLVTPHANLSNLLVCERRQKNKNSTILNGDSHSAHRCQRGRAILPLSNIKYNVVVDSTAMRNFLTEDQLPESCGGNLYHHQSEWVAFYQELEPFLESCHGCGRGLVGVMSQLSPASESSNEDSSCNGGEGEGVLNSTLHVEQAALCRALTTPALLRLRRDGPRVLAQLAEGTKVMPYSEDVRLSLERAERLFAEVEKAAKRLEQLAESRREKLRHAARVRALHEETTQVLSWLSNDGEESLQRHANMASTLPAIREQELEFDKFYFVSMRHLDKGSDLLEAAGASWADDSVCASNTSPLADLARSLRSTLRGFSDRLEGTRERLEDTSRCFHLLDRALGWALAAGRHVQRAATATGCVPVIAADWKQLEHYLMAHPPPSQHHLNEMLQLARKLGNDRLLEQCKVAQSRCHETMEQIQSYQSRFTSIAPSSGGVGRRRSVGSAPSATAWEPPAHSGAAPPPSNPPPPPPVNGDSPDCLANIREEDFSLEEASTEVTSPESSVASPVTESVSGAESPGGDSGCCCCSGPHRSLAAETQQTCGSHDSKRLVLRRSCSWQYPVDSFDDECGGSVASGSAESAASDDHKLIGYSSQFGDHSNEGCHQIGEDCEEGDLSGSSSGSGCGGENGEPDRSSSGDGLKPVPPVAVNSHLHCFASNLSLNVQPDPTTPDGDQQRKTQKTLLLIMREMIQTERDYVRSLEYVIENYIPELVREDIPQALRGQRNVIFGNIEKIYEFHSQLFLRELERCEKSPLMVGLSFLKHESKFYLYALYNKNKPKSDALMSEYGTAFFKSKQVELGDKMDLASYLLKPVQRMGKYALLLQQLLKAAGLQQQQLQLQQERFQQQHLYQQLPSSQDQNAQQNDQQNQQQQELALADQMVRFQLRHGNDLLAMDSLRDCDVNVKEQGRLLRQNEFLVWQGRGKKCLRHVFLFEELILFSKARRFPDRKNLDLYIYKHSIKMTDIGLTARLGDSSTRFEIWFRKRKPHDIFTLQAASQEVKQSWTEEISQLLWKQALRNREVRMAEMSSMGIGNKPCLDIRPSADQISDRSVSITQLSKAVSSGSGQRLRGSPSVSHNENMHGCPRRPHSVISVGSSSSGASSSSSSGTGSSNSGRSRPGDTSLCSAESGIISDMSEGSGGRWRSSRMESSEESSEQRPRNDLLDRIDSSRPSSPSLKSLTSNQRPEENLCIKL